MDEKDAISNLASTVEQVLLVFTSKTDPGSWIEEDSMGEDQYEWLSQLAGAFEYYKDATS